MFANKTIVYALCVVLCACQASVQSQEDSGSNNGKEVTQEPDESENNRLLFDDDLRLTGDHNIIIGDNVTIIGNGNQISGSGARIEGDNARIYGNSSTVIGNNARVWAAAPDEDDSDEDDDDDDDDDNAHVEGDNAFVVADDAVVIGDGAIIIGDGADVTGNHVRITGDDSVVCSHIGNQMEVTGSDVVIELRKFNFDPRFTREYQNSLLYHTVYALTTRDRVYEPPVNVVRVKGENATVTSDCKEGQGKLVLTEAEIGVGSYDINIRGDDDLVVKVDGDVVKGSRVIKNGNRLMITKT